MTHVQVRDVPEDVLANLREEAVSRGQSLQGYLRDLLVAQAGVINNKKIFDQVETDLAGLPALDDPNDVVEIIRQGRQERDRALGISE